MTIKRLAGGGIHHQGSPAGGRPDRNWWNMKSQKYDPFKEFLEAIDFAFLLLLSSEDMSQLFGDEQRKANLYLDRIEVILRRIGDERMARQAALAAAAAFRLGMINGKWRTFSRLGPEALDRIASRTAQRARMNRTNITKIAKAQRNKNDVRGAVDLKMKAGMNKTNAVLAVHNQKKIGVRTIWKMLK